MRARMSSPSILRCTTWVPPMPVTAYGMPQPLQWNMGSVCRSTSRSLTPVFHPKGAAFSQQLRSVSCPRLGRARVEGGVVGPIKAEPVGVLDGVHLVGQIGVVQEDRRTGMVDDVGDLVGG